MDIIFNQETHLYEIAEYEKAIQSTTKFIQNNTFAVPEKIENDTQMKLTRSCRTNINNKLKEIQKFRKQCNGVVMGEFNKMSLSIEKMLSEESDRLTDKMLEYQPKEPVYVFAEIKTNDKVAYDKLVAYAKELGLIKEEK